MIYLFILLGILYLLVVYMVIRAFYVLNKIDNDYKFNEEEK